MINNAPMVRLGDYIEVCNTRNSDLKYGIDMIEGVNSKGEFCPPKAAVDGINLLPYKIVNNEDFVYNPSRLNIGSLALRKNGLCIVSHLYVVFHLTEYGRQNFIPEFLYLFFNRESFRDLITFRNFGSQRPEFNFYQMSEIEVPKTSIETQRALVAIYDGLQKTIAENEALIKEMESVCHAFVVDCKTKYPKVKLGEWIEILEKRNSDGKNYPFTGVNKDKTFMPTAADTNELDNTKYKVVSKDMFVFSGMQTGRDICIRLALYTEETPILISPAYTTFVINDPSKLLPEYFFLTFCRFEMDRYGAFLSDGSIRSNLDWNRFCEIEIPLPPIALQRSIAEVFNCLQESKRIVQETRELMKNLCPALVQKAAHSA